MKFFLIRLIGLLLILLCTVTCEKWTNTPPVVNFSCFPDYGDLKTIFIFNASESFDEETENWSLKVRWDANDDGNWDSDYSIEKKFAYQFRNEGLHIVRLEVLDSYGGTSQLTDTVLVAEAIKDSVLIDPRDQKEYRTVRVFGKWWMTENLRFGIQLNSDEVFSDNDIAEYYSQRDSILTIDPFGAYYSWKEATNYYRDEVNGICPEGWHILNQGDLLFLQDLRIDIRNVFTLINSSGSLHLNFDPCGRYFWPKAQWDDVYRKGYIWLAEDQPFPRFSAWIYYNKSDTLIERSDYSLASWANRWRIDWDEYTFEKIALPLRCVKTDK